MYYNNVIIGCGVSAITVARLLADQGKTVLIIEKRNHIGGNCYDYYDDNHILIHKYGPHIFHTNNEQVWEYLSKFTEWIEFQHKVLTYVDGKLVPMPVNQDTINAFFGLDLKTEQEVKDFLENKRDKTITEIKNSRDVIISKYGQEIYDSFVKNYTKKQWDMYPEELDKEVLERLPVRYDTNPNYFNDKYQGVPKFGYTKMLEKMADHKNIHILLNTDYRSVIKELEYGHLYVSSPIDEFLDYKFGKLKYRCINFEFETLDKSSYQQNSVINYPNDYEFTRITEMKKLTFQECSKTTICREYPTWEGEPSYPVPQEDQKDLYNKYLKEAQNFNDITFIGRLGTYKYLNMDQAVGNIFSLISKGNDE